MLCKEYQEQETLCLTATLRITIGMVDILAISWEVVRFPFSLANLTSLDQSKSCSGIVMNELTVFMLRRMFLIYFHFHFDFYKIINFFRSVNQKDWVEVVDKRNEACKSWQDFVFEPIPVLFIRIIGTHNSANEIFHLVHLEAPSSTASNLKAK